jgi:hypothetical protein
MWIAACSVGGGWTIMESKARICAMTFRVLGSVSGTSVLKAGILLFG